MAEQLLWSIPETCRSLDIGRTTLYDLVRSGRLTIVKIGARSFIRADELRDFVQNLAESAASGDESALSRPFGEVS